jgi:hypothetical protein
VRRGEIWWASLGDAVGSSPGFRHPVLIVQDRNEDGTRRSFETPVAGPQRQSGPMRRCQQVRTHPSETSSSEAMSPEKIWHFPVLHEPDDILMYTLDVATEIPRQTAHAARTQLLGLPDQLPALGRQHPEQGGRRLELQQITLHSARLP